jgi:putative oxidoreductase
MSFLKRSIMSLGKLTEKCRHAFRIPFGSHILSLCLRLCLGILFLDRGRANLHNVEGLFERLKNLEIPAPKAMAEILSGVELVCGLFLIIGFFTRLASLPLFLLLGLSFGVLTINNPEVRNLYTVVSDTHLHLLLLMACLMYIGSGKISIDWIIKRTLCKKGCGCGCGKSNCNCEPCNCECAQCKTGDSCCNSKKHS